MDAAHVAKIEEVLEVDQALEAQRLGKFNPERVPELAIPAFDDVKLLRASVSPDSSYRMLNEAIAAAEQELLLYIYNVSAEHMIELLEAARDRGVTVRIMYDTTDSRGDERAKLRALGVELKTAPSSGRRQVFTVCHQKYMVIDGRTVVLGSANWATTSIPKIIVPGRFKKGNREWLIRIDHKVMAKWFAELFETDWDIPEMAGPAGLLEAPPEELGDVMVPARLAKAPDEIFDGESFNLPTGVRITPIISPHNYFDVVYKAIEAATSSVDVEQQYIKEGGPKTKALLALLKTKKSEGLTIRLIVSPAFRKIGATDSWEASVASLEKHGLDDCLRAMNLEYYTHLHNKGVIVDRRRVVVSSTNWSENSITQAREAGVLIDSPDVAEYFAKVMDFDWSIAWHAADVPANLVQLFAEAQFRPGGFEEIHPADLA